MGEFTPVMEQYRALKAQHPDAVLFFRLGDFYEVFFEDAERVAAELEIALTARDGGGGRRVPMCGVPCQAVEGYLARLVDRGYRVAICEQMEDPRRARGLVRREVVRVVTRGTFVDARLVGDAGQRYLAAVVGLPRGRGAVAGMAVADLSTGEFRAGEFSGPSAREELWDELERLRPVECLVDVGWPDRGEWVRRLAAVLGCTVREGEAPAAGTAARALARRLGVATLDCFGLRGMGAATAAAGFLYDYVAETQRSHLPQITGIRVHQPGERMFLDAATRRNLEIVARVSDGRREGSLLGVLDETVTAMGARLLRHWLEQPLLDVAAIERRLDAVAELAGDLFLRGDLRDGLRGVYDLERLLGRLAAGGGPRDLAALRRSLERLPGIGATLGRCRAALLRELGEAMGGLEDVAGFIAACLVDDPPAAGGEGDLVRPGFSAEVDELRGLARAGKEWLLALEARERERTGIKSLKVGYNRVFGYYIEVTHANRHLVPAEYVRRQTLAGAERYVTEELRRREEEILEAADRLRALEEEILSELRRRVLDRAGDLQRAAAAVAAADVLACLAEVAVRRGYVRPVVDESLELEIEGGRHPVLETVLEPGGFVPNDVRISAEGERLLVVTGPNMAGKSSFARQVALIVLLAQAGSFVPAARCRVGLVDRIFTRIGAADDLFRGQSTFMVEMAEVAGILRNATRRSLVILDEVGRGTSTFDGLAIAWAVSEHLHDVVGARTIFTTHYHELTALEETRPGVRNLCLLVEERDGEVVFLRRVVPGAADRSYGVQVARLAGLPPRVLARAAEVLRGLEHSDHVRSARRGWSARRGDGRAGTVQMTLLPGPGVAAPVAAAGRRPRGPAARRAEPASAQPGEA